MSRALLYFNTIRRMRPGMVLSRLRRTRLVPENGGCFLLATRLPLSITALDQDADYASRFDLDALAHGEFLLLNERHHVEPFAWNVPEASHLWNFNLHYFEYCVPLAARFATEGRAGDYELFRRLILSWIDGCAYPHGDAWHPYTISLRLVNWLICLDLFSPALDDDHEFLDALGRSMYRQYRHLLANQEKHLLANHYFENLKTLVICSLLFGEDDVFQRVQRDFLAQLDEQILPDGVHFERSMMYHKLILEGLLRVSLAYRATGKNVPEKLVSKAKQMLDAMVSIEKGMGKTPFFNDAADGVAKDCRTLTKACSDVLGIEADDSKAAFADSGFYKLYSDDVALVLFAGEPGPSYMLGHAHCDILSFEVSVGGRPAIVNSGTYAYQSDLRSYFRSTAAHNTAMVDGEEQMECWGEHRVARGARDARVTRFSGKSLTGEMTFPSGARVCRLVELRDARDVCVRDAAIDANAAVKSFVHITSGADVGLEATVGYIDEGGGYYSPSFGELGCLKTFSVEGVGMVSYRVRLATAEGGGPSAG